MSQYQIKDNINCFNTNISVNNVWNIDTGAAEKSEILAWLSPLEPQRRHQDIRTRRVDEIGGWLLQTQEYRNWFGGTRGGKSDDSALFCYGGPGVGKTYISSLVIDTLCRQAMGENVVVACFYFDFAAQEEQSPAAILGSVLKQIVGGLDEILEGIVKAFRDREKVIGGQRLALAEIVEFLQDISFSRRTFICIDALDECPAGHRVNLLNSLYGILQGSSGARVFLTGRPHIQTEVEKHLAGRAATRSITPTKDDIIIFLRAKLKEDAMPEAMDESLEEEIIKAIPETVSEIFLLVFLSIETILQETTIYRRRQRLSAMKDGFDLGDAYKVTLGRIKAQGRKKARLGMAVLMWISHSKRPLQVDEICYAIAIQIGSHDLNNDSIPTMSTLLGLCQGLITVDKGTSTVRLIHFTLQEYLCTHPDLFAGAHSAMAETCLTYLNFQHTKNHLAGSSPNLRSTPFLEYSSLYWGTHMRMEFSDLAKTFALEFLDRFGSHVSAKVLWESISPELTAGYTPNCEPFSALHCISYSGIAEVANIMIKTNRWDVSQRDGAGLTPLIWAARGGNGEVVRQLLRKRNIEPDQQDTNYGRTALSWAAGNGHEGVMRLFLGPQFANPKSIGRQWRKTPRVIGRLFSERYVNPDSPSKYGRTPLSWAAENGHEGAVKLLLGRKDVNPDSSCKSGRTPLWWAAERGHERIVMLFLEREAISPNTPDAVDCQTPLSSAARGGREGVVEQLLGRKDVKPDSPDPLYDRTPLLWATKNGREGVVKLLLGRKDVNPNAPGKFDPTPLSLAVMDGYKGIAELLLERKDVDPDASGKSDPTPLSLATMNGHEGIVELLLERRDVDPNSSSEFGQTPLSWAARNGHEGIVKLLLGRNDLNPDTPDAWYSQTPLSWAAGNGHEGIVELLLRREDVNPNTSDSAFGRTPLSWAARNGHEGIVKLLLERKGVDPNSLSKYGQTPLCWAAEKGHEGIVKRLLERIDINPDIPDAVFGQTPLSWAARNGREGVVKLPLERKDVDPNSLSKSGHTPLTLAGENGHDRVIELLQAGYSRRIRQLGPT